MTGSDVLKGDARHKIRIKLYPNYLPKAEGKFISRTKSQKAMSVEAVCKELKNRTTYEGDYNGTVKAVKAFLDEAVYQVCNGHSVNFDYFSLYANVGGMFNNPHDSHDREKNPITFRTRILSELSGKAEQIDVEIDGKADTNGYIDEFLDGHTKSVNDIVSAGDQFCVAGHKIKVLDDGTNPNCGVFFVDVKNPSVRLKVTSFLIENSSSKIIGVTPALASAASYRVEIVTQFAGSNTSLLKEPKTLTGDFELTTRQDEGGAALPAEPRGRKQASKA